MTAFDDIDEQVSKRVAELLLPRVLDMQLRSHAKHAFRECDCTYCIAKRRATAEIGPTRTCIGYRATLPVPSFMDRSYRMDYGEQKRYDLAIIREALRVKHRKILKDRLDGKEIEDQTY